MEHGSLQNLLIGTPADVVPEVGMGVTIVAWTDRHAGTVSRVSKSGKTFWFRQDRAVRIDKNGMSETQEYRFEQDPSGTEYRARRRKTGQWVDNTGLKVVLGHRDCYHDFSF